ncbi:hypothetical protein B0H16DRAFT_1709932 [Mycena metata]|uniref:Uncharacterized protein n=1 Tax=Mycena metata TaxID=1033252 RepID=A0AAD7KCW4_9AGAR|nr:hypothetical protein B0H16DRAFT_1709932 [Mycena metata]
MFTTLDGAVHVPHARSPLSSSSVPSKRHTRSQRYPPHAHTLLQPTLSAPYALPARTFPPSFLRTCTVSSSGIDNADTASRWGGTCAVRRIAHELTAPTASAPPLTQLLVLAPSLREPGPRAVESVTYKGPYCVRGITCTSCAARSPTARRWVSGWGSRSWGALDLFERPVSLGTRGEGAGARVRGKPLVGRVGFRALGRGEKAPAPACV